MGRALYRDYRPKSFGEVIGQDHITKTLANAIKSGRISHAYLLTGPRGVGKTSVARILAHEVNKLPYSDESIHLDIIEIDAASNRRIDEIRDLRDKVRIAPSLAKYKVYIIDEVHMLTREAFNALLKTLEEPPAHCIFILATTEAHKLPDTIVSRTQRFEFKPVNQADAAGHLQIIAKREKINITLDALEILADWGSGSFRDSISYLDQLSSYAKQIAADDVRDLLGLPAKSEIDQLISDLGAADAAKLLNQLKLIEQKGVKPQAVAASLSQQIRGLASQGKIEDWQIKLLSELLEVSASQRPQERLEICLLSAASDRATTTPAKIAPPDTKNNVQTNIPDTHLSAVEPESIATKVESNKPSSDSSEFSLDQWNEVIEQSKKQAASIYTALRLAKPRLESDKLVLGFEFPLHQKKLAQAKNKQLVADLVEDLSGAKITIESEVVKTVRNSYEPTELVNGPVNVINNIFGAAEVLET